MKNTFGNNLSVTLFGESHGPFIGAVLDGLTPGIPVDLDLIRFKLSLRRPAGAISTARVEADEFSVVSGLYRGKTTGTPLTILIPNTAQHSADYDAESRIARPGHADYSAFCKYHGFEDYHGGGHFSGRITAALVAAAAVVLPALTAKEIRIGTHIKSCAGISDRDFAVLDEDINFLNASCFACLDASAKDKMLAEMERIAASGDSVGGVLETAVTGLPAGLGEPWFDSVESEISHAVFSIPAVKGIQFGDAFELCNSMGSVYNDAFRVKDGKVYTETNHNGGINGGITNGMPVIFRTAVKPTPSIYKTQNSVDFLKMENAELSIKGRHDPAIIHRARVVVDSVTALTFADMLLGRFGTDWLAF